MSHKNDKWNMSFLCIRTTIPSITWDRGHKRNNGTCKTVLPISICLQIQRDHPYNRNPQNRGQNKLHDTTCDTKQKKHNQHIIKIKTNKIINKQIRNNQIPEHNHQNIKPDIK